MAGGAVTPPHAASGATGGPWPPHAGSPPSSSLLETEPEVWLPASEAAMRSACCGVHVHQDETMYVRVRDGCMLQAQKRRMRASNMERTSPRLTMTGQKVDEKALPLISSTRESSFAALPYAHSLASALYVLAQVLM